MSTSPPPSIPPAIKKSGLTKKQKIVLAIAGLIVAVVLWSSFSMASVQYSGATLLINTLIITINRLITSIGGLACILILSVLFYQFRQPKDLGTAEDGMELLTHAIRLERKGQIDEALTAYKHIAEKYSHLPAGHDAQISFEDLLSKSGRKNT